MNCTIKLSISYVFEKFIEIIIEDINKWHESSYSEEMLLWIELENTLEEQEVCEKQCKGCLDYRLVSEIFLDFRTKIHENNQKYIKLIRHVS